MLAVPFQAARLVDHKHLARAGQVTKHAGAHVVPRAVRVPHRPTKQVLQPVRGVEPDMLGDRPAVLPQY
jgi:hypothetical protein